MGALKTLDPDQYTIAALGVLVDGYADGEFVTLEWAEEAFKTVVGTDGQVARSKNMNKLATITVKLLQTSSSNALLSAIHIQDRAAANGAGVGPFLIRDRQGATVYAAEKAWIKKAPNVSLDKTATSREWVFEALLDVFIEGGN